MRKVELTCPTFQEETLSIKDNSGLRYFTVKHHLSSGMIQLQKNTKLEKKRCADQYNLSLAHYHRECGISGWLYNFQPESCLIPVAWSKDRSSIQSYLPRECAPSSTKNLLFVIVMLRFLVLKITFLYLFKWWELKAGWVRTCSLSLEREEKPAVLLISYLWLESLLWICWVWKSLVQLLNILDKGKISKEVFAKEHCGFWMETLSNTLTCCMDRVS